MTRLAANAASRLGLVEDEGLGAYLEDLLHGKT